jgi:hypothetical protein
MEDFTELIEYIWNEWLINHIKPILVTCIALTIGWLLGRDNLANTSMVSVINGIWKAYIVFSAVAFVDWAIHIFWKAFQQLVEGLKDFFRW